MHRGSPPVMYQRDHDPSARRALADLGWCLLPPLQTCAGDRQSNRLWIVETHGEHSAIASPLASWHHDNPGSRGVDKTLSIGTRKFLVRNPPD
jgi:hypothetical protein